MNVQGEEQKKLDVISNDVLKNALRTSGESLTTPFPSPFTIISVYRSLFCGVGGLGGTFFRS